MYGLKYNGRMRDRISGGVADAMSDADFSSLGGGSALGDIASGGNPFRGMSAWSWGDDQEKNAAVGSLFKSGGQALAGILGQSESDDKAAQEDFLAAAKIDQARADAARAAYDAKRRASFQSRALGSLAAI